MYSPAGGEVVKKNPYKDHSHVHIVQNSDHHMYFDNPEEFVDLILKDLANLHTLSIKNTANGIELD